MKTTMRTTKKVTAVKAKTKKAPVKKYSKGGLKKYQAAGTSMAQPLKNPNPKKLITYKTDAKLIDGTASFDLITNPKIANRISADYNQHIKDRLYSGKWGYDPNTGALVKLNKSQQATIPTDIKNIRREEKEDQQYREAIKKGEIKDRIDTPIQRQMKRGGMFKSKLVAKKVVKPVVKKTVKSVAKKAVTRKKK
jgi:hypothetical protein